MIYNHPGDSDKSNKPPWDSGKGLIHNTGVLTVQPSLRGFIQTSQGFDKGPTYHTVDSDKSNNKPWDSDKGLIYHTGDSVRV